MINQEIADKLREIAALLKKRAAGPVRVNAYRRAAGTVVNLEQPITEIAEHKGLTDLIALPGIGEGIARSIYEYVAMGRMSRLESLRGGRSPTYQHPARGMKYFACNIPNRPENQYQA